VKTRVLREPLVGELTHQRLPLLLVVQSAKKVIAITEGPSVTNHGSFAEDAASGVEVGLRGVQAQVHGIRRKIEAVDRAARPEADNIVPANSIRCGGRASFEGTKGVEQ
jgi:hypothetical protein